MEIRIVHLMPGRVRLRIRELRGEPALAMKTRSEVAAIAGVEDVEVNSKSGSLLIHHDPEQGEAIWKRLTEVLPGLGAEDFQRAVEEFLQSGISPGEDRHGRFVAALKDASTAEGGRLAMAAGLAGLGMVGLVTAVMRRRFDLPAWYQMLWYAYGFYSSAREAAFEEEVRDFEDEVLGFGDEVDRPGGTPGAEPGSWKGNEPAISDIPAEG